MALKMASNVTCPSINNRALLARLRRGGETRARRGLAELASDPTLRLNGDPVLQETP